MSTIIDDLPVPIPPPKHVQPKVKIEFTDVKGAKYSFLVEGPSTQNLMKIMEFVQTISTKASTPLSSEDITADTNFNKVFGLVQNKFRFGSFTSTDVLEAYQQHFHLPTTLSTISTYLARLAERGTLTRSKNGSGWIYKLIKHEEHLGQDHTEPIAHVQSLVTP